MLAPALVSPVAERHEHSGTNPAKGHNATEGLENDTGGEAETSGIV